MTSSKTSRHTQLLVIGAGPGGYSTAFRAADLGLQVILVDAQKNLGGVCLHRGCIPSKSLLHAAKILTDSRDARDIGIDFGSPSVDLNKMREWKSSVIQRLSGGLDLLAKNRNVMTLEGRAAFLNSNSIKLQSHDGDTQIISFDHAVIATGSQPAQLPLATGMGRVLDATQALDLNDIPKKLLVIGGGYIGLELGTAYAALGSSVSVCEMTSQLLSGVDRDLTNILERRLKKTFPSIRMETKVVALKDAGKNVVVAFEDKNGKRDEAEFDTVLVAVGRKPNTADMGLENTGVKIDAKGYIAVDENRRTANAKIFAVGDVTGNPMLAHKAHHEGHVAAETIAGRKAIFSPKAIPAVVFTDPEIAWCGMTETEAKTQNHDIKVVKMPWAASGRAMTMNRTDGMTKIVADSKGKILGVGIVGVGAGELISECVLAIESGMDVSALAKAIHPHPTLAETLMDTAHLFYR